jgi:hypothetical protein
MIVLGFCSCQKELSQTDEIPAEVDVYVAGREFDGKNSFGIYWKNGIQYCLQFLKK